MSSNGWREVTVDEICVLEYGKGLPERDRSGSGYPVVGSAGIVGAHSQKLVDGPAIVVGRKGNAGAVIYLDSDCWPIDTTFWVRPLEEIDMQFLALVLELLDLPSMHASTAVPSLSRDRVHEAKVRIPGLDVQRRIATAIAAADAELVSLREQVDRVQRLRLSLVRDLVSGTHDLPPC
jgi:type I restriction enzyme S subunit